MKKNNYNDKKDVKNQRSSNYSKNKNEQRSRFSKEKTINESPSSYSNYKKEKTNKKDYTNKNSEPAKNKHYAKHKPAFSKEKSKYYKPTEKKDNSIRLNRFLANAGICSRREADEYIKAGLVKVNGVVITELGTKIQPTDEVKFNNEAIKIENKVYILLNKPKDYITTTDDERGRRTVMELIRGACREKFFPLGV
jgi:16S rRNA uridine-516 pseudouridylate synthase and related pseudouridylate synthases